mmetsp:Transcript_21314/g.46469  ORF Transcript_21314/g.46469 Transcript_21314/m.46469 type:complete len:278 (+) Transcript_21314:52-885(+)
MSISFEGAWGPTERRRKVSTMILVCKGLPLLCLLLLIPVLLRAGAVDEVITDTKRTHSPVGTLDGNPRRDQDRVLVDSDQLGAIEPERVAERTLNEDSTSAPTGRPSSSSAPTSSLAPTATKLPAGEPCSDDFECMPNTSGQQACGHTVYNVTSPVICCPTGAKIEVLDEGFCVDQGIGAACRRNEMCTSGLCAKNVCVAELLAAGEQCEDHEDCTPDDLGRQACGREFYDKSASKVCCPIGQEPQDYCLNQAVGAACRNGPMCSSGLCTGGICVAA